MGAAQINSVAPLFRDDLPVSVREFQPLVSALDRLPLAQRVAGRDRLNQMLYVNAKTVLPNFILNYLADRMEMAHSIEGRVPFLDHHVAEVAARVPVNMKVKGIREKHVLREAAKDVLIPEVYDRQKHRSQRLRHATRTTRCSASTGTRSHRKPRRTSRSTT